MFKKVKILIAAIVISSFLGGAIPAQAMVRDHDDDRKCEQQIHNAERKLQEAERKHGERSRQAQSKRPVLGRFWQKQSRFLALCPDALLPQLAPALGEVQACQR